MKNYNTTSDVAAEFGVFPVSVRAWIQMGSIRAIRLGRKYLVPMAELDRIRTEGVPMPGRGGEPYGTEGGSHVDA